MFRCFAGWVATLTCWWRYMKGQYNVLLSAPNHKRLFKACKVLTSTEWSYKTFKQLFRSLLHQFHKWNDIWCTVSRLSSSSTTTRWPTTWVTATAVRVPIPDTRGPWPQQFGWQPLYKTRIDAFIFHSHSVTKHISPVIRIVHIMYGGGQNIQSLLLSFNVLPLSSAAVRSLRPHWQATSAAAAGAGSMAALN